jgi:endonuclease/exonuclease/phosphatase family metal-dependent hydrolase
VVGVGREDGRRGGEFAAILFRRDRLRVAESATFWFSDTPGVPGSRSWGNSVTRICTWARFIDRDGRGFWHYNVHLDHQSQPSRERSAALLRQRVDARSVSAEPAMVTGDFNVGERNPALEVLRAAGFLDTFRVHHPDERRVGTYTGFKMDNDAGEKIDYILVQPGATVLRADIIRSARDGRYPSDHFPVVARVVLP